MCSRLIMACDFLVYAGRRRHENLKERIFRSLCGGQESAHVVKAEYTSVQLVTGCLFEGSGPFPEPELHWRLRCGDCRWGF